MSLVKSASILTSPAYRGVYIHTESFQQLVLNQSAMCSQVPKNLELVAMPLYECYEGISRFGAVIAALPHLLSRFRLTIVGQQKLLQLPAPEADNGES